MDVRGERCTATWRVGERYLDLCRNVNVCDSCRVIALLILLDFQMVRCYICAVIVAVLGGCTGYQPHPMNANDLHYRLP